MFDKTIWAQASEWFLVGGAGIIGRLMYHARQVQSGKRKAVSWVLFWDIPIALSMGWIALGIATYFGLAWKVTISLAMIMAYLGPFVLDTIFAKWQNGSVLENFKGKADK